MTTSNATNTNETPAGELPPTRSAGPRCCGPRGNGRRCGGPGSWRQAPVNIEETAEAFILTLYAAGLDKSGIRVSAQGDVLSIRYSAPASDDSTRSYTRRELQNSSFAREFALNARVQPDAISASYREGVLTVRLPKTPDAMRPEQQVPVQ